MCACKVKNAQVKLTKVSIHFKMHLCLSLFYMYILNNFFFYAGIAYHIHTLTYVRMKTSGLAGLTQLS